MTAVFEYVTTPKGTVHLVSGVALGSARLRTVCGRTTYSDWTWGDETVSGVAATCTTCRRAARREADL